MVIAGLRLTDGGGLALLNDGKLEFSVPFSHLDGGPRDDGTQDGSASGKRAGHLDQVAHILAGQGVSPADIGEWVIDGWPSREPGTLTVAQDSAGGWGGRGGEWTEVAVAPYDGPDLTVPGRTGELTVGGVTRPYVSYPHVAGHVAAAYCTSPFAAQRAAATVLVWDAGGLPLLYHVGADGQVVAGGAAFPLAGHAYAMLARFWGPQAAAAGATAGAWADVLASASVQAIAASGVPSAEITGTFAALLQEHAEATARPSRAGTHAYLSAVRDRVRRLGATDADVLASAHSFLEDLLADQVTAAIGSRLGPGPHRLCFAGGCALNPAWATALRDHPLIGELWVPPCPDASGSALGACCLRASAHAAGPGGARSAGWAGSAGEAGGAGLRAVQWDARLGLPVARTPHPAAGWAPAPCRLEELARLLHHSGEPVILLDGRTAIGPRALGARSILAAATDPAMAERLAAIAGLPPSSPVPAICREQEAAEVFDPGTPDPLMTYRHRIRPAWRERVPAIGGPDGTAQVQTVSAEQDGRLAAILREYQAWSGIPVLCNVTAGYPGGGPFGSAGAAMEWGHLDTVWCEGVLYRRLPDRLDGAR